MEIEKVDVNQVMEKVLIAGDLQKMEPRERINYYLKTCESLGLNPMTKPFDLITLGGKMILYPNRSGTDQLRKIGNVSLKIVDRKMQDGVYIVTAMAQMPSGRTDESTGVVAFGNLKGDALANALMKCETKAKRRVTLSIMGLGWVDESEATTIKNAQFHKMDLETGNVIDVMTPGEGGAKLDIKPTGVFCSVTECGLEVVLHKSGQGYLCPKWSAQDIHHTKFKIEDLNAYLGPQEGVSDTCVPS